MVNTSESSSSKLNIHPSSSSQELEIAEDNNQINNAKENIREVFSFEEFREMRRKIEELNAENKKIN